MSGSARSGRGEVAAFDAEVGLGMVRTTDGVELAFHCLAIADGSRSIAVGTAVRFRTAPGTAGRWEAADIEPLR